MRIASFLIVLFASPCQQNVIDDGAQWLGNAYNTAYGWFRSPADDIATNGPAGSLSAEEPGSLSAEDPARSLSAEEPGSLSLEGAEGHKSMSFKGVEKNARLEPEPIGMMFEKSWNEDELHALRIDVNRKQFQFQEAVKKLAVAEAISSEHHQSTGKYFHEQVTTVSTDCTICKKWRSAGSNLMLSSIEILGDAAPLLCNGSTPAAQATSSDSTTQTSARASTESECNLFSDIAQKLSDFTSHIISKAFVCELSSNVCIDNTATFELLKNKVLPCAYCRSLLKALHPVLSKASDIVTMFQRMCFSKTCRNSVSYMSAVLTELVEKTEGDAIENSCIYFLSCTES